MESKVIKQTNKKQKAIFFLVFRVINVENNMKSKWYRRYFCTLMYGNVVKMFFYLFEKAPPNLYDLTFQKLSPDRNQG